MILPLILTLTLFCEIKSTSSSPIIDQPTSTTNSKLQEEAVTTNIFTDYKYTGVGILKIHNSRASWNDARNICLDENAQLAVIDSSAKEAMLLKHMRENGINEVWIGVHDLFGKKQWTTITGERLYTRHYVHWRNGEPNSVSASEHCVEFHLDGMNDLACEAERGFVCEKEEVL